MRLQGAPAILQAIHERLIALEPGRINSLILPKSPLGKAISYTLGQWTALQRYLEEGVYGIDNNLVENAIRPTCIGKKNWLFIGHPDAGWRSAECGNLKHFNYITAIRVRSGGVTLFGDGFIENQDAGLHS